MKWASHARFQIASISPTAASSSKALRQRNSLDNHETNAQRLFCQKSCDTLCFLTVSSMCAVGQISSYRISSERVSSFPDERTLVASVSSQTFADSHEQSLRP